MHVKRVFSSLQEKSMQSIQLNVQDSFVIIRHNYNNNDYQYKVDKMNNNFPPTKQMEILDSDICEIVEFIQTQFLKIQDSFNFKSLADKLSFIIQKQRQEKQFLQAQITQLIEQNFPRLQRQQKRIMEERNQIQADGKRQKIRLELQEKRKVYEKMRKQKKEEGKKKYETLFIMYKELEKKNQLLERNLKNSQEQIEKLQQSQEALQQRLNQIKTINLLYEQKHQKLEEKNQEIHEELEQSFNQHTNDKEVLLQECHGKIADLQEKLQLAEAACQEIKEATKKQYLEKLTEKDYFIKEMVRIFSEDLRYPKQEKQSEFEWFQSYKKVSKSINLENKKKEDTSNYITQQKNMLKSLKYKMNN